MADGFQNLPDDSGNTGKKVDCDVLVIAGQTVYRQRVQSPEMQALLTQLVALQPALQGGAVPVALQATGDLATGTLQAAILDAIEAEQAAIVAEIAKPVVAGVRASNGTVLPVDSLAQALTYDGSGNLSTITVNFGGTNYVQTLSYSSGLLTNVSAWVAQ